MGDGTTKAIEDVEVGDIVLSFDTRENIPVFATISRVFHHEHNDGAYFLLLNESIGVTPEHLMFINREWNPAQAIMPGDNLMDVTGQDVKVITLDYVYGSVPVYNLHTGHATHNYFANGVLVHNVKAVGTHGWMTVPPGFEADNFPLSLQSGEKFMVIPRGGQISSAMMGDSVNASQQIINNMQLTINSSAKTEPIVSDFEMMKSLLGA